MLTILKFIIIEVKLIWDSLKAIRLLIAIGILDSYKEQSADCWGSILSI